MIPFSFDIVYRTPNQTAVYGIDALIRSWLRRHIDKYGDVDQQLKVGIGEPFTIFGIRTVSITNWDIESPLLPHVKTGAVTPVMAVKGDGTQQCLSLLSADGEYTDIIPLTAELNGIRMALKLPVHDQGYSIEWMSIYRRLSTKDLRELRDNLERTERDLGLCGIQRAALLFSLAATTLSAGVNQMLVSSTPIGKGVNILDDTPWYSSNKIDVGYGSSLLHSLGPRSRQQFSNDRQVPSSGKKGRVKMFAGKNGGCWPKVGGTRGY